jgi:FSR family fosmidomycin resistance protein-like MFS transporter
MSDYVNRKIVIATSSILACPLLLCFLHGGGEYSIIFLSLSGITIFSASAVNVLIVQELCPGMASAVSGIAMGLVWGTAGLMLPIIGKLADLCSMQTALEIVTYLAPIAGILVFLLPNMNKVTRGNRKNKNYFCRSKVQVFYNGEQKNISGEKG